MNLAQIKSAIKAGQSVHWANAGYTVRESRGHYMITFGITDAIGLTWQDGVTLNGGEHEFYLCEPEVEGKRCHISQNADGAYRFDLSHMDGGFIATTICPTVAHMDGLHAHIVGYKPTEEDATVTESELAVMVAGALLFELKVEA